MRWHSAHPACCAPRCVCPFFCNLSLPQCGQVWTTVVEIIQELHANLSPLIFELAPDGTFTTLHNFTGSDGGGPDSPLIQSPNGDFYGTTASGGSGNYGTIFETRFNALPIDLSIPW